MPLLLRTVGSIRHTLSVATFYNRGESNVDAIVSKEVAIEVFLVSIVRFLIHLYKDAGFSLRDFVSAAAYTVQGLEQSSQQAYRHQMSLRDKGASLNMYLERIQSATC
jgi:hypothetical protein